MNERNLHPETSSLTFSNLVTVSRLGRGSTSHVFKAQSIKTKTHYAMKVIDKSAPHYQRQALLKEIAVHTALKHNNICQFVKHFEDECNHYILTEYCKDGQITKLLLKPVSEMRLLHVAYQLAMAVYYMHEEAGFAHGDIKLSNILLSGPYLKLCDFGFSVDLAAGAQSTGAFGTLLYMAPEILKSNGNYHHKQSDVWALGVCLLTLMLQRSPYSSSNTEAIRWQIVQGKFVRPSKQNFPQYSAELLALVSGMLEVDPGTRLTAAQIVKCSVFDKISQKYAHGQPSNECLALTPKSSEQQIPLTESTLHQGSQKQQQVNKTNITADTLVEQISISLETTRLWSYCLRPQIHHVGSDSQIEIMADRTVRVAIKNTEFMVAAEGTWLQTLSGVKNPRVYAIEEIHSNKKISNLYHYAMELITTLKKKQCLIEEFIDGRYFWLSRRSVGCLIDSVTLMERSFDSPEIKAYKLVECEPYDPSRQSQYGRVFMEGEKTLLTRVGKNTH